MIKKNKRFYIVLLIMVVSGIFGFIYETLFYRLDLGYFVKRGETLGPWLPIYAVGGLLIYLLCKKYKNKPFKTFVVSTIVCGILEYVCGYIFLKYFDMRLWDYNVEILNFGNIGGFICLRSVLFFGISGVFLIEVIEPFIEKLSNKLSNKVLKYTSLSLAIIFLIDVISHNLLNLINKL